MLDTLRLLIPLLILLKLSPSDGAGGLFNFKKDHAQYSLKPKDYATKPVFVRVLRLEGEQISQRVFPVRA
jgi:hypothetical protein